MKLHSLNQLRIDVTDACGRRAQESIAKQRQDFESTLADNAKFKYNGFRRDTNDFGGTPKTASGAEFTRLNSASQRFLVGHFLHRVSQMSTKIWISR